MCEMSGCGAASSPPTQAATPAKGTDAAISPNAMLLPTPNTSSIVPVGTDTTSFASTLGSELQSIEAQIQALTAALQGGSRPAKFSDPMQTPGQIGQSAATPIDISQAIANIQGLLSSTGGGPASQGTAYAVPISLDTVSFDANQTSLVTPPVTNLDLTSTSTAITGFYKVVSDRTAFVGRVQQAIAADAQRNGSPNQEAEYQVSLMQSSIVAIKNGTDQLAALGNQVTLADVRLFAAGIADSLQGRGVSPSLAQAVANAKAGV